MGAFRMLRVLDGVENVLESSGKKYGVRWMKEEETTIGILPLNKAESLMIHLMILSMIDVVLAIYQHRVVFVWDNCVLVNCLSKLLFWWIWGKQKQLNKYHLMFKVEILFVLTMVGFTQSLALHRT